MVQTHNYGNRINCAHDHRAKRILNKNLCTLQYHSLQIGENRSNNGECKQCRNKYGAKRSDKKIQHLRNMLMQPSFDLGHNEDGEYYRYNMSLVTHPGDRKNRSKQMPLRNHTIRNMEKVIDGFRRACIPAVKQPGMNHHKTNDRSEEYITPKNSCR